MVINNKGQTNGIEIAPKPVVNSVKAKSTKKDKVKLNLQMSLYFKQIRLILNEQNLSLVEKQQKIEDLWIQILSDYFKNLNTGDVTYLNKQNSKIKQCLKSFNLMIQQKFLAKKFPSSFEYLSDERLVLLTYLICYESIIRK